ncbi:MAG: hypothetical protein JST05_05145 [Acidobacteria bacterium]|nr:hypothetical protein [Acidobacteriota bacterium]
MKRALPWILTLLVAGAAATGLYRLSRRDRGSAPPQDLAQAALFTASPSGKGMLLSLNASGTQPLRSVRFLPPLPDGTVLAQALTQTGDQMVGRFEQGRFAGSFRIPLPDGVPDAFFRFAKLHEAAPLEDGSLLLLFVDGTGNGAASWLVNADPKTGETAWGVKTAGSHFAMEPGRMSCLLWDKDSLGRASWNAEPSFKPLPLPSGVEVLDAVQPLPDGRLLLAYPGGLAALAHGAWTLTPLPDPGDLAFPGTPGALAVSGKVAYWQPRPGQLWRVTEDGAASVDLGQLAMPKGREKDAALLRLDGADARGRLWFSLASPDLSVAPHPSQPAAEPPAPALSALAAMNASAAAPAPATPTPPAFDPAAWADYLKDGLDRAYVWDPAQGAPRLVDWKAEWPALGAPADFPLPLARHLQPEGGALMLDLDTRAWWVPLGSL